MVLTSEQGKSLSLICASLTWLRNFKASKHQVALQEARSGYTDEPDWLIDQFLKRKQDELLRRWEDREKRLEELRRKEKASEDRARKRRRMETHSMAGADDEDIDAEFLLDDYEGGDSSSSNDPLAGLSKESRAVLERMGLGAPKRGKDGEEDTLEEEIKASDAALPRVLLLTG